MIYVTFKNVLVDSTDSIVSRETKKPCLSPVFPDFWHMTEGFFDSESSIAHFLWY